MDPETKALKATSAKSDLRPGAMEDKVASWARADGPTAHKVHCGETQRGVEVHLVEILLSVHIEL